jgi:AraC family transcriptional regulator, transcriptional activator of pobA
MTRIAANRTIQTYNLFGEASDLPDVVHCETIAARSVLYGWEFAPHRHARLHQFLLVERGGGRATLEGRIHPLRPMQVVNVPIGHVHGYIFKPGTQGWVVTVAAEMLDEALAPSEGLRRVLAHSTVVRGTPQIRMAMEQIFAEFAGRQFARAHVLRALSAVLIGLVARKMASRESTPDGAAKSDLFRRFEALLEQHFLEHWTVSRYAAALSVTPTHLSRLTRSATGNAASQLILERIIREARRNLVYTNLPISGIAYALGFNDPAYFSRLFSAATGLSPRRFRDKTPRGA